MRRPERKTSTSAVVEHFGISPRTLRKWLAKGLPCDRLGAGPGKGNRFNLAEVAEWLKAEGLAGLKPGRSESRNSVLDAKAGPGASALDKAKLRKALAEATKLELLVDELRGDLVRRDEVEAANAIKARAFRDGLLAIAPRLAPVLAGMAPEEAEAAIREAFEELLAAYSTEAT